MPEDHPLCHSTAPSSSPLELLPLPVCISFCATGKVTDASFFDSTIMNDREGLGSTVNHEGTISFKVLCARAACPESTYKALLAETCPHGLADGLCKATRDK